MTLNGLNHIDVSMRFHIQHANYQAFACSSGNDENVYHRVSGAVIFDFPRGTFETLSLAGTDSTSLDVFISKTTPEQAEMQPVRPYFLFRFQSRNRHLDFPDFAPD
jgi:hypothetical protein